LLLDGDGLTAIAGWLSSSAPPGTDGLDAPHR